MGYIKRTKEPQTVRTYKHFAVIDIGSSFGKLYNTTDLVVSPKAK